MARRIRWLVLVAAMATVAAFVGPVRADPPDAKAMIKNTAGEVVAVAHLSEEGGLVAIKISVSGLPAGFHGWHVHDVGSCTPTFGAAGPHFNPAGAPHPGHAGDLPVLLVLPEGKTQNQRVSTDRFSIAQLLEGDGTAFIIHEAPDNYTDPATGAAGARVACGVIEAA